jgi:hypothetical protein
VQPFGFCKTMAECHNSAVISENLPDMDFTDKMNTSWNVSSASRKRAPKPALRNEKKFMKSTDSLVDVTNRFNGLTDEEEGEILTPFTKVPPTPPPNKCKSIDKCKSISFTRQKSKINFMYSLNNTNLEKVNKISDEKLTFKCHCDMTISKAKGLLGFVKRRANEFKNVCTLSIFVCLC